MAGLAWGWQQARLAEARVSQSLRELLNERSAKERAVAEGQQERLRSRTSRAESILSSITRLRSPTSPTMPQSVPIPVP
jgi:hypothetical protein